MSTPSFYRLPPVPEPLGFMRPEDVEHMSSRIVQYRGRNYNIKTTVFLDGSGSAVPVFTFSDLHDFGKAAFELGREDLEQEVARAVEKVVMDAPRPLIFYIDSQRYEARVKDNGELTVGRLVDICRHEPFPKETT